MELDEAYEIARRHADAKIEPGGSAVQIVRAELREGGWLFFYTSRRYLETRNFLDALGGGMPILVADGEARTVPPNELDNLGLPIHPGAA